MEIQTSTIAGGIACSWADLDRGGDSREPKKTRRTDSTSPNLRSAEEIAIHVDAWFKEPGNSAAFIAQWLGDIARAQGMSQKARDTGLSRESLSKALSGERTPGFDTILKGVQALGLKGHAEAAGKG